MGKICFYCTGPITGRVDPEHVLPAALGTNLTTRRVCRACNQRAGVEVDQPWLSEHRVEESRRLLGLPDRRGRAPGVLSFRGQLEDGSPALVTLEGDEVSMRRLPVQDMHPWGVTLSGYTEDEADRAWQRLVEQGIPLSDPVTVVERGPLTVTVRRESAVDLWPRFAAKVALAFASTFADDAWASSDSAAQLREVLWNGHPDTKQDALAHPGIAWSALPLIVQPWAAPLRIGEHLLACERTEEEGSGICLVLFGDLIYRVPAGVPWPDDFAPTCWFGPEQMGGRQLPYDVQMTLLTNRPDAAP